MNPQDRFCLHHIREGPVYTSNQIRGVLAYLWGRDVAEYVVYVYEMPVMPIADLEALGRHLYRLVLELTYPHGTATPLD